LCRIFRLVRPGDSTAKGEATMWRTPSFLFLSLLGLVIAPACPAAEPVPPDFRPDPLSVQRYGPAYRYPQAGWIVLHIEGEPYERGYQHGHLVAPEIAAYLRCSAAMRGHKAPGEAWNATRALVNALFVRRYEREFLEEMMGIADGAAAAGARFEGRPVDLVDVVAMNAWPEIETLDSALEATPTGLEGMRFPGPQPRALPPAKPMHCSAFAATGPATADGKIVFGHITMFGLYPSLYYNVWLDVKPTQGRRVFMQTYPGGIQSGMDFYYNDAGLLVSETTIAQTRFDISGKALASRIRQALQYADSIDRAVEILKDGNNGLYTNEWLLGDVKTNEIAMFELGTHKSKLYRSSKNEWFGPVEGFYWGCNNEKDLDVRLETIAGVNDRPANLVWRPSDRDKMWLRLYRENKGKIDVAFGKRAFTTPPVAAFSSLDAKFTTTDLAKELKTWALFGPPLGRAWEPTKEERGRYPEVRALVGNPWTVLHAGPPPEKTGILVADLKDKVQESHDVPAEERRRRPLRGPAWHGTILPKADADVWLASAFAGYERIVAEEQARRSSEKTERPDEATKATEKDPKVEAMLDQNGEVRQLREKIAKDRKELEKRAGELQGGPSNRVYQRLEQGVKAAERELEACCDKIRKAAGNGSGVTADERLHLGLALFTHRSRYAASAHIIGDIPLNQTKSSFEQDDWYRIAAGKGVLLLHELRRLMGDDAFLEMMDSFGREHAGKAVSTAEFQAHAAKAAGTSLDDFFAYWTKQPGLPVLALRNVRWVAGSGDSRVGGVVEGEIVVDAGPRRMNVEVSVENGKNETTQTIALDGPRTAFTIGVPKPKPSDELNADGLIPLPRVVLDSYGLSARVDESSCAVGDFFNDLEHGLIVYGTADESASNREAADALQRLIVQMGANYSLPVKSEKEVTDEDLKANHLLLVGRPDSNRCVERFRDALPVRFGPRSVTVDRDVYAHAGTAVIAAAPNPLNRRYSVTVFAGLSADSTWHTPARLRSGLGTAQVLVFPAVGKAKAFVVPGKECVCELKAVAAASE
jgi:hypothetical protein